MAVFKRRNRDTWQFVVDLEPGPDGKRRQKTQGGFTTRAAAKAAEAEYLTSISGLDTTFDKDSVGEYLTRWLKTYAKVNVAPSTYQRYGELVRLHLIPHLGKVNLRKLKATDIDACYAAIMERRSAQTALHAHRVLSEALGSAVKKRILGFNPALAADAPKPARFQIAVPTLAELGRIFDEGDSTPYGSIYRFAFHSGMRQGELLALRWEFVDFEASQITVVASARRMKGQGVVMRQPKTEGSRRTFAVDEDGMALLAAQKAAQAAKKAKMGPDWANRDLVFSDLLGRPLAGDAVGRAWKASTEAAQVPGVRFHDLRHCFATYSLRAGVPMKVVQTRLGHTVIGTTADIYSHLTPDMDRAAAEAFGKLLRDFVSQL